MGYTPHQKRVAFHILSVGKRKGASRKELVASIETALAEANLGNPKGGSGTSAGWRQEINSYGSVAKRTNVRGAARRYFDETRQVRGKYRDPGALSQAVQRSAFPSRYGQYAKQASDVVNAFEKGKLGKVSGARYKTKGGDLTGKLVTTPGIDRSAERQQLKLSYLHPGGKMPSQNALLSLAGQLSDIKDTPSETSLKLSRTKERRVRVGGGGGGARHLHGNRQQKVVELGRIAQKMGLHSGENPKFGGVAPVHVHGSYHYRGRAVDVSGDPAKMRKFAHYIAKNYPHITELFWRGSGSVNIKNGQRVGRNFVSGHQDHVHIAI